MFSIRALKRRDGFTLDVAIEVSTSGVVGLFGRSGCGKTTLVNIVAGLLAADEAHVEIDGVVLEDSRSRTRLPAERRRIGYVFQDARLFPHLDALGNLRYAERRAHGVEKRISLDFVVHLLGLEALLQRRVQKLSGGERQRVALGRALLSQPRLLLLDEPLASLDIARREEVLPYFERLRDELSIPMIYVSHQFEEVLRLATHAVLLEQGRVVTQGSLDDVSLHPDLRAIVGPEAVGSVLDRHRRGSWRRHRRPRRSSRRRERVARRFARRARGRKRSRSAARARCDPGNGASGEHQRSQRHDRNDCAHRRRRCRHRHDPHRHRRTVGARARHARRISRVGSAARQEDLGVGEGSVDSRTRIRAQSAARRIAFANSPISTESATRATSAPCATRSWSGRARRRVGA